MVPRKGKLKHRSTRPDYHPVNRSCERVLSERVAPSRIFILLAFVLPIVCGLNLFASKPAAAVVLVSNFGQTNFDFGDIASNTHAQRFTTGTNSMGYNLQSIEIVVWGSDVPSTFSTDVRNIRAELWSSVEGGDRAGHPKQKITDLTVDRTRTSSPLIFYAPEGTVLSASTSYHLVFYSSVSVSSLYVRNTSSNNIDSCEATGWSIASSSHYLTGRSPSSDQRWTGFNNERKMRINGTVIGKDSVPTVSLALTPSSISEKGGVSTVTATLSAAAFADVTVSVSAAAVSPTKSGDFTLSTNKQLTIAGGETTSTGTVTITGVDNNADSPERTVTVSGTASCGGVLNPADETLTILDDETAPTVSLVLTPSTISENGGESTVTATLSAATSAEVTVTVSASAESPATNDDFTLSTNKVLRIAAGSTTSTGTVTITGVDNKLDASDKTVTVSGTASGGAVSDPADQTLTITDDDGQMLTLVLSPSSISENGGESTVTATLSTAATAAITVTVSASAVSPAVSGDFNLSTNKRLTIASGSTSSTGTVTITAVNNLVDAPNKTVTVSGAASGGGVSNPADQTLTIADDDAQVLTLALSPSSISENGGESTVSATLSTAATAAITVTVSASAVSPAVSGDFNLSTNKTLSIAAGQKTSTGEVTITAVNNSVDAPNKTVTVSGTASGGGVSSPSDQTLTITDDENTPTVTLVLSPTSISENGGESTVTASLSGASSAAVSVTVSASAVSPAVSGDFNLSTNKTLSIAAGATASTGEVTITAVNNLVDTDNKTVTVSGTASGGGVSDPSNQTLTITDDDAQVLTLVLSPSSISENGGVSTVSATLSTAATAAVTVTVSASAVSPAVSGDFDLSTNKRLTIASGATASTGTVTITAVDNEVDTDNKTVTVSATASGGGVSNPESQTLTITDDDAQVLTLTLSPSSISENGGSSTVTAALSTAATATVTVTVSASAVSPALSGDFDLSTNKRLTIASGEKTSTGTVTITAVNNSVDAPNKTVTVSGAASGGGVSSPSDQTLTITDDENTPTVTLVLSPTSISENSGESTVTAMLSVASSAAITVTVSVSAVNPAVNGDFTVSTNKTLSIAAGATTSTGEVTITAVNNSVDAPNKTVTVSGTASGGGVSNPADQTLTITDDDAQVLTLVLSPSSISENGGTSTVTATLSTAATAEVTVTVSASAVSPAVSGDFTVSTNKRLTIASGETASTGEVTITAVNNSVDTDNKSVTVSGAVSGGGVSDPADQTLTITDDDAQVLTLVLSPSSISENGGESTVTATLSSAATAAITVTVSASAVNPAVNGDFTVSTNKTLSIAAGATTSTGEVTITAVNNSVDAPNKTVTVSGAASGGEVSNPADQTLIITDDENTPTVTLVLSPSSISENGESSTVTATLSVASSAAVSVTVSAIAVSPANNSDFTVSTNKTLTIAAGATSSTGEVTITAVNNSVDAPNKTVTVSGTASGGGVSNPADQTLTITDDDAQVLTLVLSPSSISENGGTSTVTATLSTAATAEVTVTVSASAVSPAVSGDFTVSTNKRLTIASGETASTGEVTITAVNNSVDTDNKSVTVSGAVSGGGVSDPADQTLTITDDDAQVLTLVLSPSSISENGGESTVTATLSTAATAAITVTVSANAVSPAVSGDFNLSTNKRLTIAPGSTSSTGTVTITAVNNSVDAPNKTVTVSGTASGGGVSSPSNQALTIADDDGQVLTLVLSPSSISENGGESTVTATLSTAATAAVTVTVSASAVSPAVLGDFSLSTNKRLTIAAGETSSTGTVTITAVNNSVDADNKTVTVSGTVSGGGVSNPADQTLTITDDDAQVLTLVLSPSSISENGGESTVTATLSTAADAAVTVTVSASAVNPAVNGDFTVSTNKTLSIAAGATTSTGEVTITAVNNSVDAPNKTVTVSGTASGGGVSNPADQTLTITDDDAQVLTLVLSPSSISENGGTSTVTATLSTAATAEVTVTVSASAVSPAVSDDFTVSTNETLSIAAGETSSTGTVTITAVNNSVDAPNKTVTVSGAASGGGVSNPADQTLTITDDDAAVSSTIALHATPDRVAESAGEIQVTVTATLPGSTTRSTATEVTVKVGEKGTAIEDTDYAAVADFTLTIAAGEQSGTAKFSIDPTQDATDEGSGETVSITGTTAVSGFTVGEISLTITDDDTKGLVLTPASETRASETPASVTPASVTVTEASGSGNTASYKVKLATQPSAAVTVSVSSGDTDAATVNKTSLNFTTTNWNQPQTVTVTGVDDDIDNMPDRTATVSHSASGGDYDSVSKDLTVTVIDDEVSASVSIDDTSVTEGDTGTADLMFRVTLSQAMDRTVTVEWTTEDGTATAGVDYNEGRGTLTFAAGDTVEMVTVRVMGDQVDESDETLKLKLRRSADRMNITDGEAIGTIIDDDEPAQAELIDLTPWIVRFGRTVTDQSLDMISARLKRTAAPGGQVTIAGQRIRQWSGSDGALHSYEYRGSDSGSLYERAHLSSRHSTTETGTDTVRNAGIDLHHDRSTVRYQKLSERVLLTGSSISLTAEADSFGVQSASLWGQGTIGEFNGRSGEITVDGKVSSGFFGIDFATSEKVMGLAVGYSRGKGGYRDKSCEDRRCDGDIETSLSGVYPYAGLRLSERLSAWAAAGHAEGDLKFRYASDDGVLKTDLQYKMAAAGLRGEILASGADGASAAWKTDVRFTRISSDAALSESGGLKASVAKVWLARMGIEAAKSYQIGENGVVVTPSAQMSLRFEGGDADTGHGAEAQIGLNVADRDRGLSLDAEVRGLAVHKAEGFREWNARAALAWNPNPSSAKGISMSLEHAWGSSAFAGSVEDSLIWQNRAADIAARGNNSIRGSADSKRIRFAMGYGVPVFGSRYIGTPNLGIEVSDDGTRDYRIGWRMTAAKLDESGFLLTADITRQESVADSDPEYGFMLGIGFRF